MHENADPQRSVVDVWSACPDNRASSVPNFGHPHFKVTITWSVSLAKAKDAVPADVERKDAISNAQLAVNVLRLAMSVAVIIVNWASSCILQAKLLRRLFLSVNQPATPP
jgi:hypothetical protein